MCQAQSLRTDRDTDYSWIPPVTATNADLYRLQHQAIVVFREAYDLGIGEHVNQVVQNRIGEWGATARMVKKTKPFDENAEGSTPSLADALIQQTADKVRPLTGAYNPTLAKKAQKKAKKKSNLSPEGRARIAEAARRRWAAARAKAAARKGAKPKKG